MHWISAVLVQSKKLQLESISIEFIFKKSKTTIASSQPMARLYMHAGIYHASEIILIQHKIVFKMAAENTITRQIIRYQRLIN